MSWGEFQAQVLDTQERFDASESPLDASMLSYFQDQQSWAAGIVADACFDPALRAFRAYLGDLVAGFEVIDGRPLSEVPTEDLLTARAAIEDALDSSDRLTAAITIATDVCNRS